MATAGEELLRQYAAAVERFWDVHTTLSQVVIEDFPNPDDPAARPTRYHLDAMRDLALRAGALVEGYEFKT